MSNFKDHFSRQASTYAVYRPKSPPALFEYLTSLSPARHLAWDAGTGNGQAAVALARTFDRVIATDASAEQIGHAEPHEKVSYRVARAETSGIVTEKVDLVTVAQAIHWFDPDAFYAEVRRVAAPRAVIAIWTYRLANISKEIDEMVLRYYDDEIGKYWPPERRHVDAEYKTVPFPFTEIAPPKFEMSEPRTLAQWTGYLYTWSATQRAIAAEGGEIFENLVGRLERAWGDPLTPRPVTWPLSLRVGYIG